MNIKNVYRRVERVEARPLIVAVDDEALILKLLTVNLRADGYEVVTASNGEEAMKLMDECEPALIILDIMLPGLDGFQVLKLIRQRSSVPVIVLTARAEEAVLRDSLLLGADDYMQKPFSLLELAARIKAKSRRAGKTGMVAG
jgi:DNA-binding response OmpR family regulator